MRALGIAVCAIFWLTLFSCDAARGQPDTSLRYTLYARVCDTTVCYSVVRSASSYQSQQQCAIAGAALRVALEVQKLNVSTWCEITPGEYDT